MNGNTERIYSTDVHCMQRISIALRNMDTKQFLSRSFSTQIEWYLRRVCIAPKNWLNGEIVKHTLSTQMYILRYSLMKSLCASLAQSITKSLFYLRQTTFVSKQHKCNNKAIETF